MKLMDIINEMKIKVLSGHLTALDKKVVKQMLDKKMETKKRVKKQKVRIQTKIKTW